MSHLRSLPVPETVIVDYDAGNLRSVQRACAEVGLAAEISADPARLRRADRIIFPGVGQAGSAMATLNRTGLADALRQRLGEGVPVLGICLGLQISLDHSEEGDTPTLSLVAGDTRRFHFADPTLKVPHMGWNTLSLRQPHPVLKDLHEDDAFYFVHSYYTVPQDPAVVLAEATYEQPFCCALGKDNYVGVQFHTEKSGRAGLALLARFAAWDGVFKGAAGEASRAH
jgi:glutamine amidotransferase